jgi:hypothetical protein
VTLAKVDRAVAIGEPLVCPGPVIIADTSAVFVPMSVFCTFRTSLRSLAPAVTWASKVTATVNLGTGRMADTNERTTPILRLPVLWINAVALQLKVLRSMLGTLKTVKLSWPITGITELVALPDIGRAVISFVPLVTDADAIGILM